MAAKANITIWVGTRKGAFAFRSQDRKKWETDGPHHRGAEINHVVQDPVSYTHLTLPTILRV